MKKVLMTVLITTAFFLGITYVYAQEENIMEGEDKPTEIIETTETENPTSTEVSTPAVSDEPVIVNEEETNIPSDIPATVGETPNDNQLLADEPNGDNTTGGTTTDIFNPVTNYSGTKTWNDGNDIDKKRPEIVNGQVDPSIMKFVLMAKVGENGTPYETDFVAKWSISEEDPNVWNYVFENIPIYDEESGEVIYYYVVEQTIPTGYDDPDNPPVVDVTDTTYTIENVDGSGFEKTTPCDETDFDITQAPTDIFFVVLKKGNEFLIWTPRALSDKDKQAVETEIHESGLMNEFKDSRTHFENGLGTYTLSGGTVEFKILEATNQIRMTLLNSSTWSYWGTAVLDSRFITYSEGTTSVTNTHVPETRDITVSKVWKGTPEQDGVTQPESVQVQLYAGTEKVGDPVTLNADNDWSYTFEGLAVNKDGQAIEYRVEEIETELISLTEEEGKYYSTAEGFVVTNTYITLTRDITVSKVWDDRDNYFNIRPESVTINLYANGYVIDSVELNEANNWTYTWEGLAYNDKGEEIEYTIDEDKVEGYETEITGNVDDGFTVTNFTSGTGGNDVPEGNPKTADSIYTYISMLFISLIGLLTFSYKFVKNN